MIVYGINTKKFVDWVKDRGGETNTGAYFYAKEIEENILPNIDSNAFVVTTGASLYKPSEIPNNAVVVCHDNRTTALSYRALFRKNILWVCSKHSTVETLRSFGERAVYIPLSIDTEYVSRFKTKKTEDIAYVGNAWAFKREYLDSLPSNIKQLSDMKREELLREMAKYKRVIAEGRCLMEAQVLGAECEVPEYPDGKEAVFVTPIDNRDTIEWWRLALEGYADGVYLKVLVDFHDTTDDVVRRAGDAFLASNERAESLLKNPLGLVETL